MKSSEISAVLNEIKAAIQQMYGPRFEQMILYGSYARGDEEPESDLDILLVLRNVEDPLEAREQLSPLLWKLALEHQMVFSVLPVDADDFEHRKSPLLLNIAREGVSV